MTKGWGYGGSRHDVFSKKSGQRRQGQDRRRSRGREETRATRGRRKVDRDSGTPSSPSGKKRESRLVRILCGPNRKGSATPPSSPSEPYPSSRRKKSRARKRCKRKVPRRDASRSRSASSPTHQSRKPRNGYSGKLADKGRKTLRGSNGARKRQRRISKSISISDCSNSAAAVNLQSSVASSEPPEPPSSSISSASSAEDDEAESTEVVCPPKKASAAPCAKKDDIQHFSWVEGTLLDKRYRVTKLLGDGTFGRVLLAAPLKGSDQEVAIKVIRNVEKYTKNAKRESEILKDIRDADSKKSAGCVRMHETFTHVCKEGKFFCLAFEVLGASLYDVLKQNRYRGFWVQDIQSIAQQCLEALSFLHSELSLTHTDLKLENVLFQSIEAPCQAKFPREAAWLEANHRSQKDRNTQYVRPRCTQIKLIDFGNATYELEHHSSIINTRQYRAPEVILSLGWNERSDLWSVGCIIMELYTGELLFRTHESLEHLALMEHVVQSFPIAVLDRAGQTTKSKNDVYLTQDSESSHFRLHWPDGASSECSALKVSSQKTLSALVLKQHRVLAEFVASLLIMEPLRRPSASIALVHPFLFEAFQD